MTQPMTIHAATPTDVPTLATITHASFATDKHTRLKARLSDYHHGTAMTPALESWTSRPRDKCVVVKAMTSTGEILGWACWAFVGFGPRHEFVDAATGKKTEEGEGMGKGQEESKKVQDESNSTEKHKKKPEQPNKFKEDESQPASQVPPPKIQQLAILTSDAMTKYNALLTPPGAKCVILIAISILPSYQSLGIGTSLIKWGTSIADANKVYTWVSSSHLGVRAFQKCGCREVGRLEVCLDDYAEDEEGRKVLDEGEEWGTYVWWYLRRDVGGLVERE